MPLGKEADQNNQTVPLSMRPVRESLVGRQFDANNKEWLNDFFKRHPVELSTQEKKAFEVTQLAYDTLAVKFRDDPAMVQVFSRVQENLQVKLSEFIIKQNEPVGLVSFLEAYANSLQSEILSYSASHQEEWNMVKEQVGPLANLDRFDNLSSPDKIRWLFTFVSRLGKAAKKNERLLATFSMCFALLLVLSLATGCAAPSQDGLTAGGGAVPAVVAPENPNPLVDLLNRDVVVSVGTPIVEDVQPTDTPIPPTDTPIPTETPIITPTVTVTETVPVTSTVDATAVVTNTVEITPTVEAKKATLTVNSDILNVRDFPSAQNTNIIAQLKKGEVVGIIGKATNGWWNVELADGKTGWTTNGTNYVTAVNTDKVEVVKTPNPPKAAPAPTQRPASQEVATVVRTVSNSSDTPMPIYEIVDGKPVQIGTLAKADGARKVVRVKNNAYFLETGGYVTLTTTGFTLSENSVTVKVDKPTAVPIQEVTNAGTTFDGFGDVINGADMFNRSNRTFIWTNTPIGINIGILTGATSIDNDGTRRESATFAQGQGQFELFHVLDNPDGSAKVTKLPSGNLLISVQKLDGSNVDIEVNPNGPVYLLTNSNYGGVRCVQTGINYLNPGFLKPGDVFGRQLNGSGFTVSN